MNKQKKTYVKPGIVYEDFRTGELRGTPEMIEKYKAAADHKTDAFKCPFVNMNFPCASRSNS